MSRPDNLGTIPYADTADRDPDALPFEVECGACGAEPGEPCRPMCIGEAAALDEAAASESFARVIREHFTPGGAR
jgi:hypothetical protein